MEFNATFIVAFISFVIFIFIMNMILYKPIYKIISERQKLIDDNYEAAKTNSSKSRVILEERDEKLVEAKASSRQKIATALEDANLTRSEKILVAKKEAKNTLENNKNLTNEEKEKAIQPLKDEIKNLAQMISDKILKEHEAIEEIDNQYIENIIQG